MSRLRAAWESLKTACTVAVIVSLFTGLLHDFVSRYTYDVMWWKQLLLLASVEVMLVVTLAVITYRETK